MVHLLGHFFSLFMYWRHKNLTRKALRFSGLTSQDPWAEKSGIVNCLFWSESKSGSLVRKWLWLVESLQMLALFIPKRQSNNFHYTEKEKQRHWSRAGKSVREQRPHFCCSGFQFSSLKRKHKRNSETWKTLIREKYEKKRKALGGKMWG